MTFVIVLSIFLLDRLTKFLAVSNLSLSQSVPVINNVFHLTLVHNRGAAFGILRNQVPLFIVTSLCAIVMIYFHLKKDAAHNRKFSLYTLSLCLILAGALGNLCDRVFLGYVIDFLDFRVWPVFNIADSSISVGAALLAVSIFREPGKGKPKGDKPV